MSIAQNGRSLEFAQNIERVVSWFDDHAIEESVRLKERFGAQTVAISVGPSSSQEALRRALAMGCEEAVLVQTSVEAASDSRFVARALAKAISELGDIDLVLCGRQAADWDNGHVPMALAEALGIPALTPAVALSVENGGLTAARLTEGGQQKWRLPFPCLVAVSNEINEPRYPTLRGVLDSHKKDIATIESPAPAEASAAATLLRIFVPEVGGRCEIIEGDSVEEAGAALAAELVKRRLVLEAAR